VISPHPNLSNSYNWSTLPRVDINIIVVGVQTSLESAIMVVIQHSELGNKDPSLSLSDSGIDPGLVTLSLPGARHTCQENQLSPDQVFFPCKPLIGPGKLPSWVTKPHLSVCQVDLSLDPSCHPEHTRSSCKPKGLSSGGLASSERPQSYKFHVNLIHFAFLGTN
jgi:hypothetical protein